MTRYKADYRGDMYPHETGDWVRWEDAEKWCIALTTISSFKHCVPHPDGDLWDKLARIAERAL